jgi:hypothetical protein
MTVEEEEEEEEEGKAEEVMTGAGATLRLTHTSRAPPQLCRRRSACGERKTSGFAKAPRPAPVEVTAAIQTLAAAVRIRSARSSVRASATSCRRNSPTGGAVQMLNAIDP